MKFQIGRLGGLGFGLSMLVSFIIIILLILVNAPMGVAITFVFINLAWMVIFHIGRLHDVGYSGWWTILVMMTSLLGIVALGATSGMKEANKYGGVPPRSVSHLFHFWRMRNA